MTDEIIIQPDPDLIIVEQEGETTSIIIDTGNEGDTTSIVIDTGQEGPPGPPGPAGDGSTITKIATANISGHRVVIASGSNGAAIADKDTPDHMHRVIGITRGAATTGSQIQIAGAGEMTEPSWNWSLGPVWLGSDGVLTQTLPTTGFILMIGTAIAPTVLMVKIGAPISLT